MNQFTSYNQRTPAVAALAGGGFVIAWVSEQQRATAPVLGTNSTYYTVNSTVLPSVDIYARLYQGNGVPPGGEFLVDTGFKSMRESRRGRGVRRKLHGGMVGARHGDIHQRLGHLCASIFHSVAVGNAALVNTHLAGNQYAPHLRAIGLDYLAVWTSLTRMVRAKAFMGGLSQRRNTGWR